MFGQAKGTAASPAKAEPPAIPGLDPKVLDERTRDLVYLSEHLRNALDGDDRNGRIPPSLLETIYAKLQEMKAPLEELRKLTSQVPVGAYKVRGNRLNLTLHGEKPQKISLEFPQKPKIYAPGTDPLTFRREAYDITPYVTIGVVGWSALKPATIENAGTDLGILTEAEKKKMLQNAYDKSFNNYWQPIYDYLLSAGLEKDRIAFVSSPSYCGIDQIMLDYAAKHETPLGAVGPYGFMEYAAKKQPLQYPLLLENSVEDYGQSFSEVADITVCTGGRKHAWMIDFNNQFVGNRKPVVPVDLMKDFQDPGEKPIDIPMYSGNKEIENAAKFLIENGGLIPSDLAEQFAELPDTPEKKKLKHPAQKLLAVKAYHKYMANKQALENLKGKEEA